MDFIILTIGLAMLVGGAEFVVRGSVSLGKKLKISLFAIGVVVVAAGTSLPELANCVRAVVSWSPRHCDGSCYWKQYRQYNINHGRNSFFVPH